MAGAIAMAPSLNSAFSKKWMGAAAAILVPWLAAESYYALPFIAADLGFTSREAFRARYVAFMEDFQKLDRILPKEAKLYVPNTRMPAFYAPRPVLFTLSDWDHRTPLYRFVVLSPDDRSWTPIEPQDGLVCGDEVYRNNNAVVAAFRTPGRPSESGVVVVQGCQPAPQFRHP